MIEALALALTLLAGGSAVAIAGAGVTGRFRRPACTPTLVVLQAGLLVQAVCNVAAMVRGHRPAEPATHIAYLVVSLLVLPIAGSETRRDSGGWSAVLLAVAFAVVAVLVARMAATWR